MVYVFKNWKLLFENICGNTCGWKSTLKCVKCCLKSENSCLKTLTKHPQNHSISFFARDLDRDIVLLELFVYILASTTIVWLCYTRSPALRVLVSLSQTSTYSLGNQKMWEAMLIEVSFYPQALPQNLITEYSTCWNAPIDTIIP